VLFSWLPFGYGSRCAQVRKEITDLLESIIVERQKQYHETGVEELDYLNDYITQPHKKSKEPWTVVEMVERTLATFFAARVNSVKTLYWTMLSISVRPYIVDRLRQDLDRGDLSFDFVDKLDYVDLCIRESVRPLYGVTPGNRVAMEPVPYKGYVVPKGYLVGGSSYSINRDPKIFPEPDKFIPERWAKGGELRSESRLWAFFGGGRHRCRGEKFALLQLQTIMAYVFKKYDFKWVDQKEVGQLPPYKFGVGLPTATVPVRAILVPRTH